MSGTVFRLGDGVPGPLPAILGPWASVAPGVSFGASGARAPVWSVQLPGNAIEAGRALSEAERELDVVHDALSQAERRLSMAMHPTIPVHFAPGAPEGDLLAALAVLPIRPPVDAPSFETRTRAGDAWDRAHEAFANLLDHLRHLITGVSWVETSIDGRLVARTLIGRLGDQATAWQQGVGDPEIALHTRAVSVSLASSAALVGSLGIAVRGLSLLGMVSTGPAGALLALPAIWTFVDDVVSRIRTSRVGEGRGSLLP